MLYKASRNVLYRGILYKKGEEYELEKDVVKVIGKSFEALKVEEEEPIKPSKKKDGKKASKPADDKDEGHEDSEDAEGDPEPKGDTTQKATRK